MTAPTPRVDRLAIAGEPSAGERPIVSTLQVVWRGRWIVAVCLLISMIVGYVRTRRVVPVYSVHSKLLLQQSLPNFIDPLSNGGQSGGYLNTQCEIIHSSALLTKALGEPGVADADCLKGLSNPVGFLKTAVLAGAETEGQIITVGMDSTNPQDAATIVNGVVSAYITYLSEQHQSYAMKVLKWLDDQRQLENDQLKAMQDQLTKYKKENPDLALLAGNGMRITIPHQADLNQAENKREIFSLSVAEAGAFQDDEKDAESLRSILNSTYAEVGMPPVTEPVFDPSLAEDCRRIENTLDQMGPNLPSAIALKAQLAKKKREISLQKMESAQKYREQLDEKLRDAQQRAEHYKKLVDQEYAKAAEVTSKEADYDHLMDQIQNTRNRLAELDGRIKAVNVNEQVGTLTASVLEPAVPSYESASTGRTKILGMAIVIGLMAGLGGSLLMEFVDQRFRSVEEISRLLSLPILGSVPHILPGTGWSMPNSLKNFANTWLKHLKMPGAFVGNRQWRVTQNLMECGQAMHLQPRSDVAEAYRAIRTGIYYGLSGAPAKTILITSPASGDGKTTLASNLSIAIAQSGRRVLLIDADCWRPAQHEIFGLTEDVGLTSVLLKKSTLAEAVRKTDVEKLDVLPCGELPSNPAELLESQALVDLLNEASEQYDQILIDSPPVVPITDARILAASCGATILVLRAGKSTRHQADEAFEALAGVGAPVLGVVVNDVVRPAHGKSYQYYRYSAESTSRFSSFEHNGNGNGHAHRNGNHNGNGASNGNGLSKHLAGPIVEIEEVDEKS